MYYKKVDLPSDEPVQFVGVYVLRWKDVLDGSIPEPTVGFVEVDDVDGGDPLDHVDDIDSWATRRWKSASVCPPDEGDE